MLWSWPQPQPWHGCSSHPSLLLLPARKSSARRPLTRRTPHPIGRSPPATTFSPASAPKSSSEMSTAWDPCRGKKAKSPLKKVMPAIFPSAPGLKTATTARLACNLSSVCRVFRCCEVDDPVDKLRLRRVKDFGQTPNIPSSVCNPTNKNTLS